MDPRRRLALASLLLLVLAAAMAACGGSGSGASSSPAGGTALRGANSVHGVNAPLPAAAAAAGTAAGFAPNSKALTSAADSTVRTTSTGQPADVESAAVISTGDVALRAPDVSDAKFQVQKVTDQFGGQISDEDTQTGTDGTISTSHLVLRIPSADFEKAMDALPAIGDLESSSETSKDVTTQVIDNQVRIKVERASITSIQRLLDRATSIRDVITIEGQLASRQAALNSLEQQQAYLADQTSLSTITVDLERTPVKKATVVHHTTHHSGFIGGLLSGWHGLRHFGHGLAIVVGALLPWAIVLLVVGAPALLVVRRVRRRHPTEAAPDAA